MHKQRLTRMVRVAVLALALSGLVAATQGGAEAVRPSGRVALHAATRSAVVGSRVFVNGKLPTRGRRPVAFQVRESGWKTLAKGRTTAKGAFGFSVTSNVSGTYTYRVSAARAHGLKAVVTRTTTVRFVPRPAPAPALGSRQNPYAAGTSFALGPWSFSLGYTNTDAWGEIAAENMYNSPPEPGWSYVMVPVTYTYEGSGSEEPYFDTGVEYVGSDGIAYSDWQGDQMCGVLPDDASDIGDMYAGASATGNICAVVPTSAIAGGSWRVTDNEDYGAERFVRP